MSENMFYIKDNSGSYTVVINNGQPFKFDASHPSYSGLVECLHTNDADEFVNLYNTASVIEDWSEGEFECRDGFLYFEGEQVASQPTKHTIELLKAGHDHEFMLNYLKNLYENVSERAVQESYPWSSHKGLPITKDGYQIAYRGVTVYTGDDIVDKMGNTITEGDFVDKYTGKSFRNNIGDKPRMKRRQVCDDHRLGCASGLHVGTYDYANEWAGKTGVVLLVKFNPKDIVSVPSDCEFQKMRVSEYEVISIAREQLEEPVYYEDLLNRDLGEDGFDDHDLAIDEFDDLPF